MRFAYYRIPIVLFSVFFPALVFGQTKPDSTDEPWYQSGYNEVFTDSGKMRVGYQRFEAATKMKALTPAAKAVQALSIRNPLQDKVQILPIPIVLTNADNDRVKKGARQRALALAAFFEDVILGSGKIFSIIDQEKIRRVFQDENWNLDEIRRLWKGKSIQYLSFQFGPDLARTKENEWAVLEDNLGRLGGIVDYTHIRNVFVQHHQLDQKLRDEPGFLYQALGDFFLQSGADPDKGEVIAFMIDVEKLRKLKSQEKPDHDLEWLRRAEALELRGIPIWNPLLLTDEQEAHLRSGKIKAIVNFSEPSDWSKKRKFWTELFLERGIYLFQPPGIAALTNKGFLEYVPLFIEFYLGQKPIFITPETKVLAMNASGELLLKPDKVYKLAAGLQGKDIYITHRLSTEKIEEAKMNLAQFRDFEQTTGAPAKRWIEQQYVEPSFIPAGKEAWLSYLLDFRPITIYNGGKMRTTPTPWVRASSSLGEGKNNVSRGALEAVAFTEDCKALLVKED